MGTSDWTSTTSDTVFSAMGSSRPTSAVFRSKLVIALCLCLAAGFVDAVGYLTLDWVLDTRRREPRVTWGGLVRLGLGEKSGREALFMGGLWLMFLLGAAGGTLLQRRFGLPSLGVPMALLLAVAVYDGFHPINPRGEG